MLIAYDGRCLDPVHRSWGVGVMVANIVSRLQGDFDFLGLGPRFESPVPETMRHWRVPMRKLNLLAFEASPMLARDCDVYWGTNHIIPALANDPQVVTVHDLLLFKYPGDQPWSALARRGLVSSIKRARKIVTVSKTTADDLLLLFPDVVHKLEVVYSGFDYPDSLCSLQADVRSAPYVIMLGAHRPRKNLPLAIATVAKARELGHDIRLVITGDIHSCFKSLVLSNSFVDVVGTLPRNQMFTLVSNASALLFPTLYEGFGFPILESMAAKCPVIAMDSPISREIGGLGALYVADDSDAWSKCLVRLLSDDCLRSELLSRGGENLSRFSWDAAASAYKDIFNVSSS